MNLYKLLTDDDILNHLDEIIANAESVDDILNGIDFEQGNITKSYNKIDNFISLINYSIDLENYDDSSLPMELPQQNEHNVDFLNDTHINL